MANITKKPIKLAAALKYIEDETQAPIIIAAGKGLTAENIIKKAKAEGIHVHEDYDLAAILASMEIGTEIPPELYQAVAHILAFVWKLDRRHKAERDYIGY